MVARKPAWRHGVLKGLRQLSHSRRNGSGTSVWISDGHGGRYSASPLSVQAALLRQFLGGGEDPIEAAPTKCYCAAMNLLLLIIVLLLLFGGGGFYFGGPVIGGGGLGLVLLICLIVFLMGGFRAKT